MLAQTVKIPSYGWEGKGAQTKCDITFYFFYYYAEGLKKQGKVRKNGETLNAIVSVILIVSVDQFAQNLHEKHLQLGLLSSSKHKTWAHLRHSLSSLPPLHFAHCSLGLLLENSSPQ